MRWRRTPRAKLHWRDWGGDSVVHDAHSGATHQFAPLAAAVMATFEEGDASFDELAASIAGLLGSEMVNFATKLFTEFPNMT